MNLPTELLSNPSMLWGGLIAEAFYRLGGRDVVIASGSRSAPLTYGFAKQAQLKKHVLLDERSAGFFALGLAKSSGVPVALICTSGTAAANFLPAIIEASLSKVPLLVFTADRPLELRDCQAGQTIDQVKLYGHYPVWQAELAVPEAEPAMLDYLRQSITHGYRRALDEAGVVHLNIPFRDPLDPIIVSMPAFLEEATWFDHWLKPLSAPYKTTPSLNADDLADVRKRLSAHGRGLIIVGDVAPADCAQYAKMLGKLAKCLGWAVLEGGFSGGRQYVREVPDLIAHYEPLLINEAFLETVVPQCVLVLGALPTSKRLRQWLGRISPEMFLLDESPRNLDCLHGAQTLRMSLESLVDGWSLEAQGSAYARLWTQAHRRVCAKLELLMVSDTPLTEPKLTWSLAGNVPEGAQVVYANSMAVRDLECFWRTTLGHVRVFVTRGANGIDGTLSVALGVAESADTPTYLVTGDLAFLHDSNGLLHASKMTGSLTVILNNNNGGGIFENLPIAQSESVFEMYFATPEAVDFSKLCAAHAVEHLLCEDVHTYIDALKNPPARGMRVLEIRTERKSSAAQRKHLLHVLSEAV